MKSLFTIDGYHAVISHIQNIYPPEKDRVGWQFGFKYKSGIYEFFTFKTVREARREYERCAKAVDDFYENKRHPLVTWKLLKK